MNGRNKIYAVLVVCGAIVVSVWLLEKPVTIAQTQNVNTDSVAPTEATSTATNTDWQNILVSADPNAQTTSVVPSDTASSFDDTTLTAQTAKDFFGQYLNDSNQGQVTSDQANQIAQNVLSNQAYTNGDG